MTGKIIHSPGPIRRLGSGAAHHFFGYYNKTVWDRTGQYVLANRVPVADANLTPRLEAEVGFFDLADNDRFHVAGKTTAWNWQMGCQLQWLDGAPGRQLIYNCRTDNDNATYPGYASVVYDVDSASQRQLPLPIYSVAPDSRFALCINYSRLYITHETIGYAWEQAPESMPNAPQDDGIHRLDIATGASQLVISYADLRNFHPVPSMEKAIHWVSHIEISPDSSRFLLLHRWTERVKDETCFLHRLITANPDGTEMRLLEDSDHPLPQLADDFDPNAVGTYDYEKSEYQISHPLWCADGRIIVWGPHAGSIHYHRYTDAADTPAEVIGEDILTENGHMSFSPVDARWLLSDTYPDASTNERTLFLYDTQQNIRHDIGSFYADPNLKKENRCDLHPRWSRDGKSVCIDSVHEKERQMYVIDVSQIVNC
ncbi:MAG: hypothetical protein H3C29_00295 [Simplicispira suum]|uniref:hypothetical protein n=1 Tax=Simplicispira suum TaxID=2109915 RepID=UPI001C6B7FE6|nr:hypothetical protein [Simplicispira suum]MBW7831631.1 hypothetical protein [Simplicispira suum]